MGSVLNVVIYDFMAVERRCPLNISPTKKIRVKNNNNIINQCVAMPYRSTALMGSVLNVVIYDFMAVERRCPLNISPTKKNKS